MIMHTYICTHLARAGRVAPVEGSADAPKLGPSRVVTRELSSSFCTTMRPPYPKNLKAEAYMKTAEDAFSPSPAHQPADISPGFSAIYIYKKTRPPVQVENFHTNLSKWTMFHAPKNVAGGFHKHHELHASHKAHCFRKVP